MRTSAAVLVLALALVPTGVARAADDTREHRLALAAELFTLTGGTERVNQIIASTLASMNQSYRALFEQAAAGISDPTERQEFLARYEGELSRFNSGFTVALNQRADPGTLAKETMLPVYADLYTSEELQELLDFYKSPLGQKLIRTQPERMALAVEGMMARLGPLLEQVIQDSVQAERARLAALAAEHQEDGQ